MAPETFQEWLTEERRLHEEVEKASRRVAEGDPETLALVEKYRGILVPRPPSHPMERYWRTMAENRGLLPTPHEG